jgi:osmotically-inducible protein OsmY
MSAHCESRHNTIAKGHTPWVKRPNISRLTDSELVAAATDAIEVLTTVPQESLKVTARNGWLHLEGTVHSGHQRTILEDVTRHLPGVQGVIDSVSINAAN